jgi:DtxR family Mn-dependent transcriptional regulator
MTVKSARRSTGRYIPEDHKMPRTKPTYREEDYLKTIQLLKSEKTSISVNDLSKRLKIRAASVSETLDRLVEAGLVEHPKYGNVELTAEGSALAEALNTRYEALLKFLVEYLQVPPMIAETDACGMEHSLSSATLERIKQFVAADKTLPR